MKPQSLLFTIYGDYVIKNGATLSQQSLIKLMSVFGFTEAAVRAALYRMRKKGVIRDVDGRIELSQDSLKRTMEGVTRVYGEYVHHWDGIWRILVYNLSEERREIRDRLRRELMWKGFGQLAQSTWISPNPVEKSIEELILKYGNSVDGNDYLFFFTASFKGNPQEIVGRCWNLAQIEGAYREFISEWESANLDLEGEKAFVAKLTLVHEYRKFLNIDPMLPQELLPRDWIGYRAHEVFVSTYSKLAPKADEYFFLVINNTRERLKTKQMGA